MKNRVFIQSSSGRRNGSYRLQTSLYSGDFNKTCYYCINIHLGGFRIQQEVAELGSGAVNICNPAFQMNRSVLKMNQIPASVKNLRLYLKVNMPPCVCERVSVRVT